MHATAFERNISNEISVVQFLCSFFQIPMRVNGKSKKEIYHAFSPIVSKGIIPLNVAQLDLQSKKRFQTIDQILQKYEIVIRYPYELFVALCYTMF